MKPDPFINTKIAKICGNFRLKSEMPNIYLANKYFNIQLCWHFRFQMSRAWIIIQFYNFDASWPQPKRFFMLNSAVIEILPIPNPPKEGLSRQNNDSKWKQHYGDDDEHKEHSCIYITMQRRIWKQHNTRNGEKLTSACPKLSPNTIQTYVWDTHQTYWGKLCWSRSRQTLMTFLVCTSVCPIITRLLLGIVASNHLRIGILNFKVKNHKIADP